MIILGTVKMNDKYNRANEKSQHVKERKHRLQMSLESAKPLFHFAVIENNQRQIHVLYEDATLIVFNELGKIITVMLLGQKRLNQYIMKTEYTSNDLPGLYKCAKIHDKLISKNERMEEESIVEIREKKLKYISDWYFNLDRDFQGGRA